MKGSDMTKRHPRAGRISSLLFLILVLIASAVSPTSASAAEAPPLLWQVSGESGAGGSGAGKFAGGQMAASPVNGHIYLADRFNARVEEFDPWGVFVRAWGWGVRDGQAELEVCTAATGCQQGLKGTNPGQFEGLNGIAVDPVTGDVYTTESASTSTADASNNERVQKFTPTGDFLWMIGKEVDIGPAHPGNFCAAAFLVGGDTCGAGAFGTEPSAFAIEGGRNYLTVDSSGTVFVGDKGRIQEFDEDGSFIGELPLPGGEGSKSVESLTATALPGELYMDFRPEVAAGVSLTPFVYKYSSGGWTEFAEVTGGFPQSLASAPDGTLYLVALDTPETADPEHEVSQPPREEVLSFEPSGNCVLCVGAGFARADEGQGLSGVSVDLACGLSSPDVFVKSFDQKTAFLTAYGPPPDANICPPPKTAPTISSQFATAASGTSTTVEAEINPHFWPDTAYYVEYGTGRCSEGGCDQRRPLPPGTALTSKTIDAALRTGGVLLPDLAPATTYHFRFVAEGSGGGPVYGTGPEPTQAQGAEGTFTTRGPANPPKTDCPNQSFRTGPGTFLTDCRAYEQVSPVDKGNADILQMVQINSYPAGMDQAAPEGEKLTYGTYRAFGDAEGAPYTSQYVASRGEGGWASHDVSPPRGTTPVLGEGGTLETTFRAFSSDLCQGWLMQDTDPVLAPGAVEGYANLYRADLCGSGGFEALTTVQPPERLPKEYVPELQGVSEDGHKALFVATAKLTPNAAAIRSRQLYAASEGSLELVSVLPDGTPCQQEASAGAGTYGGTGIRTEAVARGMSADGSRIYWSCGFDNGLYLRREGEARSRLVSAKESHFWTASPDGARMIYTSGKTLYSFDAETRISTQIATGVRGVAAASEDTSRIYFASGDVLGGEEGPSGEVAEAGKSNLYFYEEGLGFRFIGTLSNADAATSSGNNSTLSVLSIEPVKHAAATTPDGSHLAFVSTAPLTGFDNADAVSSRPAAEVFLYDAGAGELRCVSCNPTGIRPVARDLNEKVGGQSYLAAAALAQPSSQLYSPRYLSADGSRLFFESFESLVPRDTNGAGDVYEFEPGDPAQCAQVGAETYSIEAEGCISLISSGESPKDSEFVDAGSNGRDVFFTTASGLVPQDSGLIDIYDAREGGGFPAPPALRARCEGEACQSPYTPPAEQTPASSVFEGSGNVQPRPHRHRRRHHRHRKHPRGHKHRHPAGRRAGR
jgi:DNA-binding beta-propeller fold protein YncE